MPDGPLTFRPVVILGAGRSGTNMLRDAMTGLEGFATWPCDEINPVWRHGNLGWPNDEIPPLNAKGKPRRYIRNAFQRIWRESGQPAFVVEKTCANTLRVPFVEAVLSEARYIHIIRDGVDVIASAQRRWKGNMEIASLPYYWSKIKYAPLGDLPTYGLSFLKNRLAMAHSKEKRMKVWGPRFAAMESMQHLSLDEICAHQWVECVNQASAALAAMPSEKHMTIHYEAMTENPIETLQAILDFLKTKRSEPVVREAVFSVSRHSVGKGRKSLTGDVDGLMKILGPTLLRHGYNEQPSC